MENLIEYEIINNLLLDPPLNSDSVNEDINTTNNNIANCDHIHRNHMGIIQTNDEPIPCDFAEPHFATIRQGDVATVCDDCGAIMCHSCDLTCSN